MTCRPAIAPTPTTSQNLQRRDPELMRSAKPITTAAFTTATAAGLLQTNFYKTELELDRCLMLSHEGPCECDLYLSCTNFVTTPASGPRLRERLAVETTLVEDAPQRGWHREVERHQRVTDRIRCLLTVLGELER